MLNLIGKLGMSRLFTFWGHDRREDLDVLATVQGLEAEFVHQLFNRINAPNGLTSKDVVLVWGNNLLAKLDRFKERFVVNILCVDGGPLDSLQAKLRHPIQSLMDVTGQGLKQWIEQASQKHFATLSIGGNSDLFDDCYFAGAPPVPLPTSSLSGILNTLDDQVLVKESFCPIPPLRATLARETAKEDEEDECSNDGKTYTGCAPKRKRPLMPSLTTESLSTWAERTLKVEDGGKLPWARLKDMVEDAFNAGKPSDALLRSAGLGFVATKGNRWVVNQAKKRLVPT
jgi:hypothetical protein